MSLLSRTSKALDSFASAVSPEWGAERIAARMRFEALKRHYEGASSKRHREFRRNSSSVNGNIIQAHESLVSNARYLHDNNATARRGIDIITKYTAGITPHAVRADGKKSPEHEAKLKEFADTVACDPAEKQNLYAQQSLIVRTLIRDGEALIERVVRPDFRKKSLPVPLQTRVLECD
ncbi:MAG: phage portal protein, partial [Deltaproteobacteria bacterium]|nr:phage portal protein [Deltaproteobacteria bacterium]